jgi:hypothetical protein
MIELTLFFPDGSEERVAMTTVPRRAEAVIWRWVRYVVRDVSYQPIPVTSLVSSAVPQFDTAIIVYLEHP